jgi:hypothetical protein
LGSAPDSYGTTLASNGARHQYGSELLLGTAVGENDGVVFESILRQGQMATVRVTASQAGLLDAFLDFNADGDFADDGEKIFDSVPVSAGENLLSFLVPADAVSGPTYARFRISSAGGLRFDGPAADGEVEDYRVTIGLWQICTPFDLGRYVCNVDNATPGGVVTFVYGTQLGPLPLPQFGVTLGITDPTYFGQGIVGPTGHAASMLKVPTSLLGQMFHVQAFEQAPHPQETEVGVLDDTAPTVAIFRAADQPKRSYHDTIRFTVEFSLPVHGFVAEDLVISGTASEDLVATLTGSGAVYDVTIQGMIGTGTVHLSLPAGVVHDAAGHPN